MGKLDQVGFVFWFIIGIAVVYLSYRLGLGQLTHPGSGFLPFWCGVILCGLSLFCFINGKRSGSIDIPIKQPWEGKLWSKSVYIVIALLFFFFTFETFGFIISTIITLFLLHRIVSQRNWLIALSEAIVTSFVSYIIFALWLEVQLPRGLIERIFF
jgi:putative tricarboxylic transport membrane protein